jgi:serine/threonine-protein kinase
MPAQPVLLNPGALLGGKYRVERTLGVGGMGAVYQALHTEIGRKCAVKVLNKDLADNPEFLARFRMEARAAAMIGHPGIVDVLDMGTSDDGAPFIVMEYLEGETLSARIKRLGQLPPQSAVQIMEDVLDALAAAHGAGIVHRDLKPGNIFLTSRPVPLTKILDFGISKFHAADDDVNLTRTGVTLGTPTYMAPEQARGAKDVGPPSDLYAVGAILYKALTGQPPFVADSYNAMLAKVLTEIHRPAIELRPDMPVALSGVIDLLLAKLPTNRPADARAARVALRHSMGLDGYIDGRVATNPYGMAAVEDRTKLVPTFPQYAQGPNTAPGHGYSATGSQSHIPGTGSQPAQLNLPAAGAGSQPGTSIPIVLQAAKSGLVPAQTPGIPSTLQSFSNPLNAGTGPAPQTGAAPVYANSAVTGVVSPRVKTVVIGLACGVLAAAGAAVVRREPPPPPAQPVGQAPASAQPGGVPNPFQPAPQTQPAPAPIGLRLVAEPSTARWSLDGQPLGCNPCIVQRPAGDRVRALAQAPGYQGRVIDLTFDRPRVETVVLVAEASSGRRGRNGRPSTVVESMPPPTATLPPIRPVEVPPSVQEVPVTPRERPTPTRHGELEIEKRNPYKRPGLPDIDKENPY